jgi:3-hydroxyisobutyrate dehydrogenase
VADLTAAQRPKIAFIGLGTMGAPMARNLLEAGFDVTVHNRTREREESLEALGAKRAATPAEAGADADVVITMVTDSRVVDDVLFGDDGAMTTARQGTTFVDMSTISPEATREFAEIMVASGMRYVDAPVSGGSEGAERGTLTVMCGGTAEDIARIQPVLEVIGAKITHVGAVGSGQMTKAVNQVIIAGYFLALAEGLVLGMKAGLDMDKVIEAISAGMCRSAVLDMRAGNVLNDDYPLGFKLSLHLKDMGIAIDAARDLGAELTLAQLVTEIEERLVRDGRGDEDLSVIAADVRTRAGL